jgi:hypothetical protein
MPASITGASLLECRIGRGDVLRPGTRLAPVARPDPQDAEHERDGNQHPNDDEDDRKRGYCKRRRIHAARSLGNNSGRPRAARRRSGGDLLSQGREAQVPSALRGLTALFGMGRGVSPPLSPPKFGETERPQRFHTGAAPPSPELENCTVGLTPANRRSERSKNPSSPRTISTGLLSALLRLHIRPITWWSSRGLTPSRGWESSSRGRLPA